MVTVQHITENIVEKRSFLTEAMRQGIINYGALSAYIQSEIEKELKKPVKLSAIGMALRRYAEKIKKMPSFIVFKLDKEHDLGIKSHLVEITISKSDTVHDIIKQMYSTVAFAEGDILHVIHGNYEITIITQDKYKERFLDMLKNEKIKTVETDKACVMLKIPKDVEDFPGFFAILTRTLAWNNVSIDEFVNTAHEVNIIVQRKDVTKAYELLQELYEVKVI